MNANTCDVSGLTHVVAHHTITSSRLVEEGLQHQAQQLGRIMDAVPQLVCVTDPECHLEYCNQNWREMFGARPGEEVEQSISARMHAHDRHTWLAAWCAAHACGTAYQTEHRLQSKDEGHWAWYLECGTPIRDRTGCLERWLITMVQVDERRRREDELRSLLNRKDEFFAMLLHELRNPLAPIANALEVLGRQPGDTSTVVRARGIIHRQLRLLSRLVDDLLDVSRIERGSMQLERSVVDVADIVASAVETARPLIELRKHHLATSVPRGELFLDADPVRLGQVLTNLLINAAKYTNPGGYISVRAERATDRVLLHVRDSGVGIASQHLGQVFDLFAQAESASAARMGGLGIGLAVARQLVDLHGGSISVHSEGPGRGSEFTVSLPCLSETPSQGA
jgi:PAS domain S-box-containing protein